jgi:predicted Zn-dependent protease
MARVLADLHQLDRSDDKATLMLVEGRLRSGDIAGARADSERLLSPAASPQQLDAILATWARFATGRPVPDSSRLAAATQGDRRVSFASYFNRIGKPAEAAALLGNAETPVRHSNVRWNAVFAQALALQGRSAEARKLFDQVLDTEPDQIDALRGRSALRSRLGMHRDAIVDALRLVSLSPGSGEDRLVLARAYLAAGNRSDVRRTLWQAFQDLPDDERIFAALRSVLVSTGDLDGQQRLKKELADQRVIQLTKELI